MVLTYIPLHLHLFIFPSLIGYVVVSTTCDIACCTLWLMVPGVLWYAPKAITSAKSMPIYLRRNEASISLPSLSSFTLSDYLTSQGSIKNICLMVRATIFGAFGMKETRNILTGSQCQIMHSKLSLFSSLNQALYLTVVTFCNVFAFSGRLVFVSEQKLPLFHVIFACIFLMPFWWSFSSLEKR